MKKIHFIFFVFVSLVALSAYQPIKLTKTKIHEDISLELPKSFTPLTGQEMNEKYISYRKPLALYSDESRQIDLGVNVSVTSWSNEDLQLMKEFYRSSIMNLYDTVMMINESMEEINGKQYAIFEFISSVSGDDNSFVNNNNISKYTYMQYTLINGKTLLFNFTCPNRIRSKWSPIAHQIMQSIKIKNSF